MSAEPLLRPGCCARPRSLCISFGQPVSRRRSRVWRLQSVLSISYHFDEHFATPGPIEIRRSSPRPNSQAIVRPVVDCRRAGLRRLTPLSSLADFHSGHHLADRTYHWLLPVEPHKDPTTHSVRRNFTFPTIHVRRTLGATRKHSRYGRFLQPPPVPDDRAESATPESQFSRGRPASWHTTPETTGSGLTPPSVRLARTKGTVEQWGLPARSCG